MTQVTMKILMVPLREMFTQIYGAMHQIGEDYVLHVGDIDVLSLSVNESRGKDEFQMYPNPASGALWIGSAQFGNFERTMSN